MRCKNCARVKRHSMGKAKCWRNWQLCPPCAVKLHPESYPLNQRLLWDEKRDIHGEIRRRLNEHAGMRNKPYKLKIVEESK